ncbi:hypothetical protein NECAME_10481 [Necator americanus]|uniref:Uncharacterized protein n=1 Tax=Necator americanus TaxID=51031 RepID=W2T9N8_NECAM|nr:hypothetical protein NECAME_10481 [Necator americanus]ETN78284.1 hypothetical protein NECAME_10481 [Necator americanus]
MFQRMCYGGQEDDAPDKLKKVMHPTTFGRYTNVKRKEGRLPTRGYHHPTKAHIIYSHITVYPTDEKLQKKKKLTRHHNDRKKH